MKKTVLLLMILVGFISVNAQNKAKTEKAVEGYTAIKEGKGMDGVTVGRSTKSDIEKKFGKDYKWVVNKKYSYQMTYANLGLAFYICQSDKKQQIFDIEMRSPFKAKTSRGVILGKSTLADVQKLYGKKKSGTEYRGVSFYYNRIGGKDVISVIDVTENSGIRQCKVGK